MTRAERRARMERQKQRAARYYGHGWRSPVMTDPRAIGIAARTPQQCSDCCGNRRKWEGATRQERRAGTPAGIGFVRFDPDTLEEV